MQKEYTSRQRKIYEDYSSQSDASLETILSNRGDYNDDIMPVIEDILAERGLRDQREEEVVAATPPDPVDDSIRSFIYTDKYDKTLITRLLIRRFGLSAGEAEVKLQHVYDEEKNQLRQTYHLDLPRDNKAMALAVAGFVCGIIVSVVMPHIKNSFGQFDFIEQWTLFFNVLCVVLYLVGIVYIFGRARRLGKNIIVWMICSVLFQPVTLCILAYAQHSLPSNLVGQVEHLRKSQQAQLSRLDPLADDYYRQRDAIRQSFDDKFYGLLFDKMILNPDRKYKSTDRPAKADKSGFVSRYDICPACGFPLEVQESECPACGLKFD
jgi:hypothetical protein